MPKVLTDEKLIDEFLNRGVEHIFPSKEALKQKLMSGERIRAYQGFDPTGPYLHVGHAMGIRALRILQQLGHEVIFLVGDFTARVGDPDKETGRQLLTEEEIKKNMSGWKKQAGQLIDFGGDNPVKFMRNYTWLSKLKLVDLINLMSKTTVQQMIERDMFQRRLEKGDPIGLQEFIYPLMQGYDSVAMEVDLEIGGTDQIFNMLMGRNIVKAYLGKEKFVRANKMMDAPDGRTMSKTKGNGINLADSAKDMYGKAMSYPDELIIKGMRLLTTIPLSEIAEIEKQMQEGANPMEFKKYMAFEIVKMIKGEQEAIKAQRHFETTVQRKEIAEDDIQSVPLDGISNETGIISQLQAITGESKSYIRRLVEQGGIYINGERVEQEKQMETLKRGDLIKIGKRRFFRVI